MVISAVILAKSESQRLPNKNILDFHGKSMFLVNVEKCLHIFDKVYVTSDDPKILKMVENIGAIGILRGKDLCGSIPNIPVYRHALDFMGEIDGIVAVQANSPNVPLNTIALVKKLMELGGEEVMTCHSDYSFYGSVWGLTRNLIIQYEDFYKPKPNILIVDDSIDIHTKEDYLNSLKHGK